MTPPSTPQSVSYASPPAPSRLPEQDRRPLHPDVVKMLTGVRAACDAIHQAGATAAPAIDTHAPGSGPIGPAPTSVVIVRIPTGWSPRGDRTPPPSASRAMPELAAACVAVALNRKRMRRGSGTVFKWTCLMRRNRGFATIDVDLPAGWTPATPRDLPPVVAQFETRQDALDKVTALNRDLPGQRLFAVAILRIRKTQAYFYHRLPGDELLDETIGGAL